MLPEMDVYGLTAAPDLFRVDDLLDFTNEDLFPFSTNNDSDHHHLPEPENHSNHHSSTTDGPFSTHSSDFTDELCVPNDDVAELEWLSKFVDDSFTDFPANEIAGSVSFRPDTSFPGRNRSKRSRALSEIKNWSTSSPESDISPIGKSKKNAIRLNAKKNMYESSSASSVITGESSSGGVRRCTHCASQKTPQWRTGPLGPKTLCNACGVRYKSGRLVPEYRPAASPTFVLTQHSNSHRKVMELRRQKESLRQQEEQQQRPLYHHHDFQVC